MARAEQPIDSADDEPIRARWRLSVLLLEKVLEGRTIAGALGILT